MSDTASQFATKTKAMFDACRTNRDQVVRTWMSQLVTYLLPETRGPGNQKPASTLYLATGRLRAGYHWIEGEGPESVTEYPYRKDDGPFDESTDGSETRDRLIDELYTLKLTGIVCLWNDVGYGYLVHEGLGRHKTPDKWMSDTAIQSSRFLAQAQAQASVASRA